MPMKPASLPPCNSLTSSLLKSPILSSVLTSYESPYLFPGIEKSENIADISKKYRISGGIETIIVTDYRSTEKSTKSSIYRRNIGEAPIYRRKIASGLTRGAIGGEFKKNRRKYRRYFGIFTDFSENFPIFPTNPARTHRIQNLAQKSWI